MAAQYSSNKENSPGPTGGVGNRGGIGGGGGGGGNNKSNSSNRSSSFFKKRTAWRAKSLGKDHWDDVVFGMSNPWGCGGEGIEGGHLTNSSLLCENLVE